MVIDGPTEKTCPVWADAYVSNGSQVSRKSCDDLPGISVGHLAPAVVVPNQDESSVAGKSATIDDTKVGSQRWVYQIASACISNNNVTAMPAETILSSTGLKSTILKAFEWRPPRESVVTNCPYADPTRDIA